MPIPALTDFDGFGSTYSESDLRLAIAIAIAGSLIGGGGGGGGGLSQAQTTAAVKTALETATNLDQLETKLDAIEQTNDSIPLIDAKLPTSIGTKTALGSFPVTLASDDAAVTALSSIDIKTPTLVSGRQPVDGSGVTQPISAVSLPLPTNASTSALQTTGNTSLGSIDTKLTSRSGGSLPNAATDPALVITNRDPVFLPTKLTTTGFLSIAATNTNLLDASGAGAATNVSNYQSGKLFIVSTATTGSYTVQGAVDSAFTVGVHTIQLFESTNQAGNPNNGAITPTNTTRIFDLNLQGINFIRVNMSTGAAGVRPTLVANQAPFVPLQTNVQQASGNNLNAAISSLPTLGTVSTVNAVTTVTTVSAITNLGVSTTGASVFRNTAVSSTAVSVKNSPGRVHGINVINPNATPVYLKIYNLLLGSTVVGTSTPFKVLFIPASDRLFVEPQLFAIGNCATGITIAVVTGLADNNTTAPGTALYVEIDFI
jgi:hypothetical protein